MKRVFISDFGKLFCVSCVIFMVCIFGIVQLTNHKERATSHELHEISNSPVLVKNKSSSTPGVNVSTEIKSERAKSIQSKKGELRGWRKRFPWDPNAKLDKYQFPINPEDKCKFAGNNLTLLILIKSAPGNTVRRDAARRTFIRGAKSLNVSARFFFVMGVSGAGIQGVDIQTEAKTHGDILQGDFNDNYYSLVIKLIMGFKWALDFCQNTDFVMTMDDDVMVDIVSLVNDLTAFPPKDRSQFVLGTRGQGHPSRSDGSKWYVPKELYPEDSYPVFPFGQGYVVSQAVVKKLYLVSRETPAVVPFDDVYCGILLNKLGIKIIDQGAWRRERHKKMGKGGYLQIEVPVQEMDTVWQKIEKDL